MATVTIVIKDEPDAFTIETHTDSEDDTNITLAEKAAVCMLRYIKQKHRTNEEELSNTIPEGVSFH